MEHHKPPARLLLRWMLPLAAVCALIPTLHAQTTAAISGRIEDETGAVLAGVSVSVLNLDTGARRDTLTDSSGHYELSALPLGAQRLTASRSGFQTAVRDGVVLQVGQEAVVNFRLSLGPMDQRVTVSAPAPLVNTTVASVAGMVGETAVKDLPLNGRSFDNLITLNPGAINFTLKSANTSTSYGNTFSVAGLRPADNLFLWNGIEYTGSSQLGVTPGGVSGQLLGIDAVREFNVLTDTYSAEYGKRAGAHVLVVTQSGSNSLHGTLFEFLRNSALDTRNFFDRSSVPPFRRNQFGGALGGPILRNRWFLFGNYEGFRQVLATSNVSVVPDAAARQGLLPVNGVLKPVPKLNQGMLPFMNYWPEPNGRELLVNGQPSGTALNYSNPRQSIREDFGTLRTDANLTSRDTLAGSYTIDDGASTLPLADPLFASLTTLRMQTASVQETHVLSPAALNQFEFGFSRAAYNLDSSLLAPFPSDLSLVAGQGPGGIVIGGGLTTTGGGAITSAGPNNAAGAWNRRNLFTTQDDFRLVHGRHQISAGVWIQRLQDNDDSASRQLGQATFSNLTTFLQGTVSSFQAVPSATELGWRSLFGAWYISDTIQLRPNLTLELGLRDEFTTGWNELAGRAANYITGPNAVLLTQPRVGASAFTNNNAIGLLGPRVGLAWDPFGDGKTAVRAAFGTYYSLIDNLTFLLNSLPPYNGAITHVGNFFSFIPVRPGASLQPSCGPGVPKPCATYAPQGVQPNAQTLTVEQWSFHIQRQLDSNTALSLGYVGSHGYHGLLSLDPNTIPAQVCSNPSGCVSGGLAASLRGLAPNGATYTPVSSGRPNPYLGAGFFWYTEGNSSYNALQIDLTHRLSRRLQFRANYTWSKSLDMNSSLTGAQAQNQAQMILDPRNPFLDWGPSALNPAQQASLSGSYELPSPSGSGWANKLLAHWQVNAIATLLSGFPFTPLIGANRSEDGDIRNPDRPSLNSSFTGPVVTGNPNQWFNPAAFVLPTFGTYGDLGRGVFTGPGLAELDASLIKDTALTERVTLEFRAEMFNVMNHANFGAPNAVAFTNGVSTASTTPVFSPSAGLITSTATTSRQTQFGLKLIF